MNLDTTPCGIIYRQVMCMDVLKGFQNIIEQGLKAGRIYNLKGSSAALLFALYNKPYLVIASNEERAYELNKDINFFRETLQQEHVLYLPEPDGPSTSGKRAQVVNSLKDTSSLVCSLKNLTLPLWSQKDLSLCVLDLTKNMVIGRNELEERLQEMGYRSVSLVVEAGEYSRRGWIFDIYPSTYTMPLRLEFFGDEIESIKTFHVETQRSTESVSRCSLFSAHEPSSGMTPLDLADDIRHIFSDSIQDKENLPCDTTFFSRYPIEGLGYDAGLLSIPGIGITPDERKTIDELPPKLHRLQRENKIRIIASSHGQADRLKHILREGDVVAPIIGTTGMFTYEGNISITIGDLSSGFFFPGVLLLTERELFGKKLDFRPIKKSRISKLLTSLDDLRPGDFIVHKDHGIGQFHGLIRQSIEGIVEDLIAIDYEGSRLYVPLQGISKINTYHAEEGITPKIDRLGGKTWQRTKEKVRKKIREMAEKLIALHAERKVYKGFSFSKDTELHREFDSFFPYEETPDQTKAIEDIKRDMESDRPMDRLICGDVGYGKTEVAMRAAFKAVYDGRQVAVLVPTTILCEQHFRTFQMRFSAFPVTIDYLSRFKSKKDQQKTINALSSGNIDIIVGTHSLLSDSIAFYNLGLLIIDEEHRFGVRQKEKIKALKRGVDVLALTATPIPRTLSLAITDIKELSLIETPPEERLAVKSTVSIFNENLIKCTIQQEIARNGQVFFVHNRIRVLEKITRYLEKLLPSARIACAHGQMAEKELEKVMLLFYDHKIDVLASTAIIGSGLDIPTANTIIINRADMMGLADLYQLRGRVGRSNVRAFAYFLVPGEDVMSEEAQIRLQAIQEMSYLGAGFRLALKDLEIRGAGNLLGTEQSGYIHSIGFDLYMEMLEKAVAELQGQKVEEDFDPSIRLRVNAFIPEDYIDDVTLRLTLYRRIASLKTDKNVITFESELRDRFGKFPIEVRHLLHIMRLKILARHLLITHIKDTGGKIRILFSSETNVEPQDIFKLQDKTTGKITFLPDGFEIDLSGFTWEKTYEELSHLFTCLPISDTVNRKF
jgi:transcription-repair coupling factor (superfamily II helicase)